MDLQLQRSCSLFVQLFISSVETAEKVVEAGAIPALMQKIAGNVQISNQRSGNYEVHADIESGSR